MKIEDKLIAYYGTVLMLASIYYAFSFFFLVVNGLPLQLDWLISHPVDNDYLGFVLFYGSGVVTPAVCALAGKKLSTYRSVEYPLLAAFIWICIWNFIGNILLVLGLGVYLFKLLSKRGRDRIRVKRK
ncbi:hypothetical protein [Marinomonas balearica]|uniref:Uncharacterized protein n=1 Tax=Marinomonas balearica TaxID=491947 RepID=A0A4R6M6M0_9GAMM|nr:hypothetical protein [Marinomonas balearica]TDO96944.1 hypothetical protein DFP79_2715 [Marinomonas balearica]